MDTLQAVRASAAARLDRLPIVFFHRRVMWLMSFIFFFELGDLNTFAFTPLNDLSRQLVFCENGSSVRLVMVAGRILVEDGKLLSIDEESLKAETRELMVEYNAQFKAADHWARTLEPIYRRMYERCLKKDIAK